MTGSPTSRRRLSGTAIALAIGVLLWLFPTRDADAIPAFARKHNVTCSSCHTAPPYLNRTGRLYKEAGYRMPDEDGEIDIEAQDYQELSDALYMEKVFPLSVRVAGQPFAVGGEGFGHGTERAVGGIGEFMLLTAGSFHANGSYFGEIEVPTSGGAEANGFVAFHPLPEANVYVGYATPFRHDPYNTLKGGHGFTLAPRAALSFENGLGESLQTQGASIAVSGRTSGIYYSVGVVRHDLHEEDESEPEDATSATVRPGQLGPDDVLFSEGHEGPVAGSDPTDFTARAAVDVSDQLSLGLFGWLGLEREDEESGDEANFFKAGADVSFDREELHFQGVFLIDRATLTPAGMTGATSTELAAHAEFFYTHRSGGRPIVMPLVRIDYNTANDRDDARVALVASVGSFLYENARVALEFGTEVVAIEGDKVWLAGVVGDVAF